MKTKNLLIGIFSGFVAGAVIGVLFAPYKGTVTRRKIIKQGDDYSDLVKEKFNEFTDVITDKFEVIKKDISEYTELIKNKIMELKKVKNSTMN